MFQDPIVKAITVALRKTQRLYTPANLAFSHNVKGLIGQIEAFSHTYLCHHGVVFQHLGELIVCGSARSRLRLRRRLTAVLSGLEARFFQTVEPGELS